MKMRGYIYNLIIVVGLLILTSQSALAEDERGKIVDFDPADEKIIVLYENGDVGLAYGTEKENSAIKQKLGKCKSLIGGNRIVTQEGVVMTFRSEYMRFENAGGLNQGSSEEKDYAISNGDSLLSKESLVENYGDFFEKIGACRKIIDLGGKVYYLDQKGDFGEASFYIEPHILYKSIVNVEAHGNYEDGDYSNDYVILTKDTGEKRILDPHGRFIDDVVTGGIWLKDVQKVKKYGDAFYVLKNNGKISVYGLPNGHGYALPRNISIRKVISYTDECGSKGKCIITANGDVIFDEKREIPSTMRRIKDLVASRWGIAALTEDGTMICTGVNGRVGYENSFDWETLNGLKNVSCISGNDHMVALVMKDGKLRIWDAKGEVLLAREIGDIKKAIVGYEGISVLRNDGKVLEILIGADTRTIIEEKASEMVDIYGVDNGLGMIAKDGNALLVGKLFQYGESMEYKQSNVTKLILPAHTIGQIINMFPIYYIDRERTLKIWLEDTGSKQFYRNFKYPSNIPNVKDAMFAAFSLIVLKNDGSLEYYCKDGRGVMEKYNLSEIGGRFTDLFEMKTGVGALRDDGTAITIATSDNPLYFKIYDTSQKSFDVEYIIEHNTMAPIGCSRFNIIQIGEKARLTWNEIEDVDYYIVTYTTGKKTITKETKETNIVIEGLQKGKTYTFSIAGKNKHGTSGRGTEKKFTLH